MKRQALPQMAVFTAHPRRGDAKHFTFDEYLASYEAQGLPRTDAEAISMFLSLCGEDAESARMRACSKVVSWRAMVSKDDRVYQRAQKVLRAYHDMK